MIKKIQLKNGLTVLYAPLKGTRAVTVLSMFPVGSRYEDPKLAGASHFVEHMLFKGTDKRADYLSISRELDSAGADYNAFTYKDYTGYYVKVDSDRAELAFDFISDIAFKSHLPESEVQKEKGVIVEEIRMYEDNPSMAIELLYDRAMFGDHYLGRDIAGSADTVNAMTQKDLVEYYHKYYSPGNAVVAVTGNLDPKKLKKYLKYFSDMPAGKPAAALSKYQKFVFEKTPLSLADRVLVKEKVLDQAHLMMGFPGINYKSKQMPAMAVMLTILGGGMSSRLFVEVREKRGLAYMVRATSSSFRDCGTVDIRAGLDPARLEEAVKTINAEVEKMKNEPVSNQELKDAKTCIVGRLALALEDGGIMAERAAKQFWFQDEIESFEDIKRKVNKVTVKDIQKIAKLVLDTNYRRVAIIGPVKKETIIKILQ